MLVYWPGMKSLEPSAELPRRLGLPDALAIVIGVVIGGGIFIVPNLVARELHSVSWILGVWIAAGVVSFFGALACAELGTMLPATGGQYVFLREARSEERRVGKECRGRGGRDSCRE